MKNYLILCLSVFVTACAQTSTVTNDTAITPKAQAVAKQIEQAPAQQNLFELLSRIEQLQTEVQQLRGQLEEQSYTISDLKKRQQTVLADFEYRMQLMEKDATTEAVLNNQQSTVLLQPPAQTSVAPSEEFINEKVAGLDKQVYLVAYENLRNGHTNQAISMFKQVRDDYPKGEYADNAQYWLGEAYMVNKDINSAKDAFKQVIKNYPESAKVPDAMLKLAYIENDQGSPTKARYILLKIMHDYGDSNAARLAETKLMQMDGGSRHQ